MGSCRAMRGSGASWRGRAGGRCSAGKLGEGSRAWICAVGPCEAGWLDARADWRVHTECGKRACQQCSACLFTPHPLHAPAPALPALPLPGPRAMRRETRAVPRRPAPPTRPPTASTTPPRGGSAPAVRRHRRHRCSRGGGKARRGCRRTQRSRRRRIPRGSRARGTYRHRPRQQRRWRQPEVRGW